MASTPSTRRQFEGVAAWSLAVRFSSSHRQAAQKAAPARRALQHDDRERSDAGQVARTGGLRRRAEALTPETAATLRAFVEERRDAAMAEVEEGGAPFESRFGGVNCRGQGLFGTRQDLYQPVDAEPVKKALTSFSSG